MGDARVKQLVLARRARFLAATLAATGLVSAVDGCCPQACLKVDDSSPIPPEQRDATPQPVMCLSVAPLPKDDAGAKPTGAGPATTPGSSSSGGR